MIIEENKFAEVLAGKSYLVYCVCLKTSWLAETDWLDIDAEVWWCMNRASSVRSERIEPDNLGI